MAVIGLMVMVTIVGVGLWIRSTVRAASLANAIAQSRWDDALLLDPHNVTCLIGRARGKLTVSPPDIDGAFADLDRAERQPGVASLVQPARAEAHATRAAAEARAGRLERAAQDLQAAKRGGAEQAILASAQAVIAESWLARGRQSAAKGDGAAIRSEVDEALAAGADRGAVIALWRDYVNGRIAKLDAKGVELACTESKKAGLTGVDEAKWWIRFGAIAAAPPHENAAEVIRAVDKAAAAGAQESVTAPLQASVLVLEAIALQSTGDAKGAVSKILSALLLDAGLAEQALNQPKAASLRTSVLAEYRSRFDTAVADANWPEALRVAATAGTIAKTSASWVGETFGAMPHAALASLPRPALAGLTTLAETFEKPTSGLYSRTGDPRVNGVQREEAMSFFRMTSGHDEVIAKGEPYAVYFPVLLSPTERETVEVSFRCRRFVRSPEGKDSFLAVEFVDSKTDVNAALTGPKLGQQITIYNNRMFSRQRNGHAVIGLHSIDGRSGADGHVPCMNEQEWMKVSLWLQLSKSSKNQNQNIFLWTFVNGLRLSTGVLFGDKGERLPERLGVCFIAYGSRAINSFGQREPVLGEAKGSIYDIADVTCRLIATPTRAAKTMEECQFP
jgi:tetratricopeptide (TPR) repeat protein